MSYVMCCTCGFIALSSRSYIFTTTGGVAAVGGSGVEARDEIGRATWKRDRTTPLAIRGPLHQTSRQSPSTALLERAAAAAVNSQSTASETEG